MSLIRTDDFKKLKRAKITLECDLSPVCYRKHHNHKESKRARTLDLPAIARQLKFIESAYINPTGNILTTLSKVVPVGYSSANEWLVIELKETSQEYRVLSNWTDYLGEITGKIIHALTSKDEDRIARVEYDSGRSFVIMDDPNA